MRQVTEHRIPQHEVSRLLRHNVPTHLESPWRHQVFVRGGLQSTLRRGDSLLKAGKQSVHLFARTDNNNISRKYVSASEVRDQV